MTVDRLDGVSGVLALANPSLRFSTTALPLPTIMFCSASLMTAFLTHAYCGDCYTEF